MGPTNNPEPAYKSSDILVDVHQNKIDNLLRHNNELLIEGRFEEAEHGFRMLLDYNSDFPDALNGIGVALLQQGKLPEAIDFFSRAIKSRPAFSEAYYNIAEAFAKIGQYRDAAGAYKMVLTLNPYDPETLFHFGNTLFTLGQMDEAIHIFRRLTFAAPHMYDAYLKLASTLQLINRLTEAIEVYEHCIANCPDGLEAHYNLGLLLESNDRLDESLARFQHCLDNKFSIFESSLKIANILKTLNREVEALLYSDLASVVNWYDYEIQDQYQNLTSDLIRYSQFVKIENDIDNQHFFLTENGDWKRQVENKLSDRLEFEHTAIVTKFLTGILCLMSNQDNEAINHFKDWLTCDISFHTIRFCGPQIVCKLQAQNPTRCSTQQKIDQIEFLLSHISSHLPNFTTCRIELFLGKLWFLAGHSEKAFLRFSNAIELDKSYLPAFESMASLLLCIRACQKAHQLLSFVNQSSDHSVNFMFNCDEAIQTYIVNLRYWANMNADYFVTFDRSFRKEVLYFHDDSFGNVFHHFDRIVRFGNEIRNTDLTAQPTVGRNICHRFVCSTYNSNLPPLFIIPHFPKTGGTTLFNHFKKHLIYMSNSEMPHMNIFYKSIDDRLDLPVVVQGHYTNCFTHRLFPGRKPLYIIFLRDPIDRAVSHYNHHINVDYLNKGVAAPAFGKWYNLHGLDNYIIRWLFDTFFIFDYQPLSMKQMAQLADLLLEQLHFVGLTEKMDYQLKPLFDYLEIPSIEERSNVSGIANIRIADRNHDIENSVINASSHELRLFEKWKKISENSSIPIWQ